jgi:eukaryotic-like serine/threonine-protein kinase
MKTRPHLLPRPWTAVIGTGLVLLAGAGMVFHVRHAPAPPTDPETDRFVWLFEAPERGAVLASPRVVGDRVFVPAVIDGAFAPRGVVWCLDRAGGRVVWRFDDGGAMQHGYSSPCVADGRLYVGEGMHANFACKLYCLDAATGRKQWQFETTDHIESSPCTADGRVYFGAGDDGVYCLDAVSGVRRWQLRGPWHIDTSPAVSEGRLYAGSGISRRHRTPGCLCADAGTGRLLWQRPTDLPAWGSPAVADGQAFFGLGNGRLVQPPEPPEKPAGAVVCLDAASGDVRWRCDVPDAVFAAPTVVGERVYFGARDGQCRTLDRRDGRVCWQEALGGPILTHVAHAGGRLYVVAGNGLIACLDAATGRRCWTFDVARRTATDPQMLSSPVVADGTDGRRLYVGGELRTAAGNAAVLYCLRD